MNSYLDVADNVLGVLILAGIPAYLLLQVWTARRMGHGWRLAALLPAIFAVGLIFWGIRTIAGDALPWALPFVFFAPVAAIYLLGLVGVQKAALHAA